MSRIKFLLDIVNNMRSLADSIEVAAQAMADGDNAPKAEKQALKAEVDKTIETQTTAPAVTHEMVRELALTLSRKGKKAEIKALLTSYGAANITAIAVNDLDGFYADLTRMDGDADAAD